MHRRHGVHVIVVADDRATGHGLPALVTRMRNSASVTDRPLTRKEIAHLLCITDRTVKFHAQAIYRKLDVANRTEAVCVALRQGIVALDLPVPPAIDAA